MEMVEATLGSVPVGRPRPTKAEPQGMCTDEGYDYEAVREAVAEFEFTARMRARGEEAGAIKEEAGSKARRWVVERAHSWINRFRGVLTRWNKKARNYVAMLHFAFALIAFQRC
jgi:putative transposase